MESKSGFAVLNRTSCVFTDHNERLRAFEEEPGMYRFKTFTELQEDQAQFRALERIGAWTALRHSFVVQS